MESDRGSVSRGVHSIPGVMVLSIIGLLECSVSPLVTVQCVACVVYSRSSVALQE